MRAARSQAAPEASNGFQGLVSILYFDGMCGAIFGRR